MDWAVCADAHLDFLKWGEGKDETDPADGCL